ncbi:hypothetical protein OIE13_07730 [Streptosporangium sp. NBC_01810]|uniref:hypothetical protein n=1 Tax=Streptosporangium sp. NBC_01810 TaxID=2975951 RepID=UPI002DD801EA|nr:hypothetical protein [Streptosporangium sp. NBC_01810]WSA29809.1 hypothetical protein OIE13_07730 [Streptosporangium sp. NBC_01810]
MLRRLQSGKRIACAVAHLNIKKDVLSKARLHLDATRSSALFAERMALVEGVTDVALLRQLGLAWAAGNQNRTSFVNALAIIPMGFKGRPWAVQLLAIKGKELCDRIAVLGDTDKPSSGNLLTDPAWLASHDQKIVKHFASEPTLEPAITAGNEDAVAAALGKIGVIIPLRITPDEIQLLFRSASIKHKTSAGSASRKKGRVRPCTGRGTAGSHRQGPFLGTRSRPYASPF